MERKDMLDRWILCIAAVIAEIGCSTAPPREPAPFAVGQFDGAAQDRIVPSGSKLEVVWNDGDFTEGPTVAADEMTAAEKSGGNPRSFIEGIRTVPVAAASARAEPEMPDMMKLATTPTFARPP